ncbi:Class I glutamine amidotransferase-like protein [Mycena sanguinolenta]|uniref:Class I glutamine amidotransferase-like protein n=1 Tax=Mycena sanguinolenta TaxID=230812 RepID=A0A8H6Z8M3_9AGAR|nr:Class I glutamine amidotransferase-like protein [Mycena sanguinolenta]
MDAYPQPKSNLPVNNTFNSDVSQSVVLTNSFADVPPIEVLLIPGGFGAEVPEASETTTVPFRPSHPPNLRSKWYSIAFIRDIFPRLKYLITVCTGAGLAARAGTAVSVVLFWRVISSVMLLFAGVLDGRNATTNKAEWAKTIALGPRTNWIPHARWVIGGDVWAASGVSPGTDGVLAFIEEQYGADAATRVEWVRITDSSDDPFAGLYGL